jgi:hypothetical protein
MSLAVGAHGGHEIAEAIERIGEAQPGGRECEKGGVIGHAQVAGERHGQAAADAEALHHGDDGLRCAPDGGEGGAVQMIIMRGGGGIVPRRAEFRDVGARREGFRTPRRG